MKTTGPMGDPEKKQDAQFGYAVAVGKNVLFGAAAGYQVTTGYNNTCFGYANPYDKALPKPKEPEPPPEKPILPGPFSRKFS